MNEQVITDRAEAMFLAPDEWDDRSEGKPYQAVRIVRSAPAPADSSGESVACPWCGSFSVPGPGCDSCGSPLR